MIKNISVAFILTLTCNRDQLEEGCRSPEVPGFLGRKMLVINMPLCCTIRKNKTATYVNRKERIICLKADI